MATALDIGAIRAALELHMERTGLSGRQLSIAAGLNATAVRDLLMRVDDPRLGTLFRIAQVLNISPETLFGSTVEIAGSINEHGEILPIKLNGYPPELVSRPADVVGEALAYRVTSDGLWPAYWHDDVVFVSREHEAATDEYIGKECAVQLAATGATLLRTIADSTGPGRFTLSFHNIENNLLNVQLAWAAPVLSITRHQPGRLNGAKGQM